MLILHTLLALGHVAGTALAVNPLARQDSEPSLPDRQPFGFAEQVTGGGNGTVYIVEDMMGLRTALTAAEPRTVYVKGEIKGNQINESTYGDCQMYIDTSSVPNYNFTLYIMALNSTYTDAVKAAVAANETFEGQNATEYLALLNKQNVSIFLLSMSQVFIVLHSRAGGVRHKTCKSLGSPSTSRGI